MSKKHIKMCAASPPAVAETQIKTTVGRHFTPMILVKIKPHDIK